MYKYRTEQPAQFSKSQPSEIFLVCSLLPASPKHRLLPLHHLGRHSECVHAPRTRQRIGICYHAGLSKCSDCFPGCFSGVPQPYSVPARLRAIGLCVMYVGTHMTMRTAWPSFFSSSIVSDGSTAAVAQRREILGRERRGLSHSQ